MARAYLALSRRRDFDALFRKGVMYSTPLFVVRALPSGDGKHYFACVVSTKVAKRAVVRNKAKRRLRSLMVPVWKELSGNWKIAIVVKKPLVDVSFQEIETTLAQALRKMKLLS